ncbi:MAG TPA: CHAT domain-containing tetratricopeptide repeat protein [Chitinophagaceae bacterium]|jgi:CHAT domain-containing protein/Tfp pilus assembly protein PilF|nr:CHAT domain-containing tetratricopeptide repeat protein [Chitinophagaceae bacterium]
MKTCLNLIVFVLFSIVARGQDIKKQLEEMDTAFAHEEYQTAVKLAEKIHPRSATITNDTVLVEFLNRFGSSYYQLGEHSRAEIIFLEASEKAKEKLGEADYHYALALFNVAACYKEQGRYAEAEPLYLKSLPVLSTAFGQSSVEYTRCFYTLASLYIDMGKYAEAEGMCAAAVNFYKVILGETSDDYLGAMGAMSLVYQGLGKYDKAEEIMLALKKYHSSLAKPSKTTLQTLENNLGELYRHMGDYDKAEAALLRAVAMADNTNAAAYSLNNLALVQKAIGKYSEAEQSYQQSLGIYRAAGKTNHPDYTNPLNNLGELYRTMGRLQEAVYAFEEVIELRKKLMGTDHPNYANAVNNLALVEFAIGMYPEAEKHLLECRDIYKKTLGEKDKFYANSLNNLASVYKAQGKLSKAEETYKECLRIYKATYGETNDKYGIYLGGLGGTYRQMKRYDEAITYTLQSLSILKNKLGENHYDHIETEYNLAETYREAGKFTEAEKHYLNSMKGYLLLIEKYFPFLSERDKTAFYYNVANAFETFNSFVIELRTKFPARNIDVLVTRMYNNQVALKSLLLKESEKIRTGIAASSNAELKNDYRDWMRLRETIVQQYRLSPEELESKGVSLPALEKQVNDLEQKITIALKMGFRKEEKKTVLWTDIQAGLKPGEYAVEIIRTDFYTKSRWTDTVYYTALVIDKTSVVPKMVILPDGNALETRSLGNYRRALKAKFSDEISYSAFWEPLKKHLLNAKKIYFSADGVFQQVNLYTLKNPETNKYLIDEADINLVTNTRDILQQPVTVSSKRAEIFSFPDYGVKSKSTDPPGERLPGFPDLKELPGTKIESDSIKKILLSRNWIVNDHLQKEATEDAIKKISSPQVLHIATHGFFLKNIKDTTEKVFGIQTDIARQNPLLRSGVILAGAAAIARDTLASVTAEDGILTAYEAIGLDLSSTDLVILSACETGLGELLNGQGVYGLQRAFLVAGAKSVIMSLWMIDDFATQELMINFYREWLKDPTPGSKQKAFRAAQLKLKEKYENPFYWGAFVMVGN